MSLLQYIMGKLDLKLHPVKTKIVCMWDVKEYLDEELLRTRCCKGYGIFIGIILAALVIIAYAFPLLAQFDINEK